MHGMETELNGTEWNGMERNSSDVFLTGSTFGNINFNVLYIGVNDRSLRVC